MRDTWHLPLATALALLAADVEAAPIGNILRVGDMQRFNARAGEAQSTVVPPGVKPAACPQGRLLVSIDLRQPPTTGLVLGRDLGTTDPAATVHEAVFDLPPNPGDYAYGTYDHDLVALPNGDVLYLTGAWTRRPLAPKPAWFDVAYRHSFGPGARGNLMVWRSTDCGQNFSYVSEFDPARVGDGSCALPQFPQRIVPPGSLQRPVWNMGGSDGQLVQVDRATGHLYLTFQCVGYLQDKTVTDHFHLSTVRLNKTLLAGSIDGGTSWRLLGTIPVASWRFGIVPLHGGQRVALGAGTLVSFARKNPQGNWSIDPDGNSVPGATWGWDESFYKGPKFPKDRIHANIWATTVVAHIRDVSEVVLLAFPTTLRNSGLKLGHGYRLFTYVPSSGLPASSRFHEWRVVAPGPSDEDNVAMHLAAIDPGSGGPALVYWTDIDLASRMATIRGRLVGAGGPIGADFDIAREAGARASWSLDAVSDPYWYGDYRTGSGFSLPGSGSGTYKYYPIWVQPDRTVRFAEVFFERKALPPQPPGPQPPKPPLEERVVGEASSDAAGPEPAVAAGPVELVPQVVPMNAIPRGPVEREQIEEYGERADELHTVPPQR